jgi:flagellar assembly factor FliW
MSAAMNPSNVAATVPASLSFREPIPGFPSEREFTVVSLDAGGVLFALRSTSTPELRFIAAAPAAFFPDYVPPIEIDDVSALGVADGAEVVVLVVVTVTDGLADATANLRAPIVIAPEAATAVQLVLEDSELPLRAPLVGPAS